MSVSKPTINGEKTSSAFIKHLTSYPVVSDSISTFKSNPYGAKSIEIADTGYHAVVTRAKPVIPYVEKGYQYVSPYVAKVDSLGDATLSKVDSTFPIVKKPTAELYDDATGIAFYPYKKTVEGKDYVLKTYHSEYKKVGGEGLVTAGTAALTTVLIVGSDALTVVSSYLTTKKDQAKKVVDEKANN